MATNLGAATIDFGAFPGTYEASVAVTGQTGISATSDVDAFVMADDTTATHTAEDHKWLPQFAVFTCGTPVAATGFTIYARSRERLIGTYALRWVWAD